MLMGKADEPSVCVYCDTWAQGGIEAFLTQALLHMDPPPAHLWLVCAEKRFSGFDTQLAGKGFWVSALLTGESTGALGKTLKAALPLARLCRQEHIEVVHLNVFHGVSLIQALLLKLSGVPRVIVHCHGAGLRESRSKGLKLLGHWLCSRLLFWTADERWASSKQAARFLFGNRSARIIPNGIEVERFLFEPKKRAALREELNINDSLLLGCVGRLDTQKNQQFLLPVLADLKAKGQNVELLLIGDGEEQSVLQKKAEKLGVLEDVIFLGVSDRVNDWLCAIDVLLIPSTSEGLSIVAIEGQASGLPVLCSTGVPREVKVSKEVHFLPLSERTLWVAMIEGLPSYNRIAVNIQVQNSQYNVKRSSALLRTLYLNAQGDHDMDIEAAQPFSLKEH